MVKTKTGNCCFKEARKGLLTARRMDLKIHASKLPMRKTRKAARKGIRVRVENNHGHLEQLKNIGTVAFRREKTKIEFPKESEKSSSGTKLAEKGLKRLFEERIERRMVKSDHIFVLQ